MAYEAVLLFAVAFFAAWLFFFASGARDATEGWLRYALQLFIGAVFAAYFLWCWLRSGQTLAMKAWHIRLVDRAFLEFKDDKRLRFTPSPGKALTRLLLAFLLVPTGVSIVWSLFDRERQFLHDRLAGTRLINA
jgi:uncharacterized RDD family membrane protein YckC